MTHTIPLKYNSIWQSNLFYIGLLFIVFFIHYFYPLTHLSTLNFGGGDGAKNLFAYFDYVLYGNGFMVNGMNYPYGEHITFTDNQPAFSMLIRFIHLHIFDLSNYLLSIANFWILIQIPLGATCLFLLLKRIVPDAKWLAAIGAFCIAYLSPQVFRLYTHFSLGYIFIYALVLLYLWDILNKKEKPSTYILLAIVLFLGAFSHLYVLFVCLLFVFFYYLIKLVVVKIDFPRDLKTAASILISIIASLIVVKVLDPFQFRPAYSWGLFHFNGNVEGTFYPQYGIISEWFYRYVPINTSSRPDYESHNFLGFVPIGLNIFFLISFFKQRKKSTLEKNLMIFWLGAFLLWLFSLGFFYLPFNQDTVLTTPFINHFRSIGRLGIIWYYLVGVAAVYALYKLFTQKKIVLMSALLAIWLLESFAFNNALKAPDKMNYGQGYFLDKPFDVKTILAKHGLKPLDFQCSLSLPLNGSGEYGSEEHGFYLTMYFGARLRLQEGLPTIGSVYTRGDAKHSISQQQLLSNLPTEKVRFRDMNEKPILLCYPHDETMWSEADKRLIAQSTFLGRDQDLMLGLLTKADFDSIQEPISEIEKALMAHYKIDKIYNKFIGSDNYELAQITIPPNIDTTKIYKLQFGAYLGPDIQKPDYCYFVVNKNGQALDRTYFKWGSLFDFEGFNYIQRATFKGSDLVGKQAIKICATNKMAYLTSLTFYPMAP